jgi:magnesium-transporting ATPase (P-type)
MALLFSCRFLHASSLTLRVLSGNRVVWLACGALIVLQLVFAYAPFMHSWFRSAPISWTSWALSAAFAVAVFLLAEAGKALGRRRAARP